MATLDDRYELLAQLGSGGMARVFAATDRFFDRTVAIKLVRSDRPGDPSLRARLLREARAAASFDHPCAVTVFDVGEDAGEPFIVMEFVRGRSLAEELAARGALPVEEALLIADRVLAALQAAHRQGLVHRDVKPGNVLLSDSGDVKLTDFGIASDTYDATSALTVTGEIVGTPRYLAPEQAAGQPATPQTDLYATGLLLFEMLAGRAPFQASSAVAVALAHQRLTPPPLASHRRDVPDWLEAVVQRALSKAPQDRFPSAGAFRSALRGRPRGRDGRAHRARPHPRIVVVVAVLAALLLAAAGGLAVQEREPGLAGVEPRIANPSLAPSTPAPAWLPADAPLASPGTAAAEGGSGPRQEAAAPSSHPHGAPPGHARGRASRQPPVPEHAAAHGGPHGHRGAPGRKGPPGQ